MKKIIVIFSLSHLFHIICFAQGEIDGQQKILYRNEQSIGFLLSSNGLGLNLLYGKRINIFKKNIYVIDFVEIKHPKEIKTTNPYLLNNRSFVFGKLNSFYNIRFGMGVQKEIFRKFDLGGIAIRHFYTFGPSLGLKKPIYYEVLYPMLSYTSAKIEIEKFSSSIHRASDIYGRASFFEGIVETKLTPGAFFKFGLNFEYSSLDELIHALEAGIVVDAYIKKIPIMAIEKNSQLFFAMFISYRFGRIIDAKAKKKKFIFKPDFNEYEMGR